MEINLEVAKVIEKKQIEGSSLDNLGRAYATGKRKTSIVRVWVKVGTGKITVNDQDAIAYFKNSDAQLVAAYPFKITESSGKYDVVATVTGGGLSGQLQALKHGIAKALAIINADAYRQILRKSGLLTRDARIVERKKFGHKKARKSFQFSKR